VLGAHPNLARLISALLALGAIIALLGAYGLLAALLGGMAWFALPEGRRVTTGREPSGPPRRA
jgi:hypothetical protein